MKVIGIEFAPSDMNYVIIERGVAVKIAALIVLVTRETDRRVSIEQALSQSHFGMYFADGPVARLRISGPDSKTSTTFRDVQNGHEYVRARPVQFFS